MQGQIAIVILGGWLSAALVGLLRRLARVHRWR